MSHSATLVVSQRSALMTSMGFATERTGCIGAMRASQYSPAGSALHSLSKCRRNAGLRNPDRGTVRRRDETTTLRRLAPTEQFDLQLAPPNERRRSKPLSRRPPFPAAVRRRLVGDPAVIAAVRHAHDRLAAAEEEIRLSRVPDRPMAFFVIELDQRAALTDRDDVVDQLRLGLEVVFVSGARCEGGIAAYRRSHAPEQVRR